MTKPLAEMDVRELLDEHYNATRTYRVTNSTLDICAELERRVDFNPPVATPKPLSAMSIGELLYEYRNGWDVGMRGGLQRGHDIRCEVERRTAPAPVATPKPVHDMTFDELWKEHYRLYGEDTLEANHRLDQIINEIKSRRLTGNNA